MTDFLDIYGLIGFVGASVGSFLTLVTYRLPRNEKIGMTRSRCPACGTTLRVRDLVPIFSWAVHGGRCRHCKTKVSARYPLTELACMAVALGAAWHYGWTLQALAIAGLCWCVVAIIVTDLEHYIILDEVQVALAGFGVLYHVALATPATEVITGGAVGLAIGLTLKYGFLYLRHKDGLGLGDVKLLAGAGIWFASALSFVPFLFYAGLLGVVFGMAWRAIQRSEIFPFGPALAVSLVLCVVSPAIPNQFWQLFLLR